MTLYAQPCSCGVVRDEGTGKGRGVFATRDILQGEVVEVCPVVLYHPKDGTSAHEEFDNMDFGWEPVASGSGRTRCVALGWGSLYNSANPANLTYRADGPSLTLVFEAVRHIEAGEELTINYSGLHGNHISDGDRWFTSRGIPLID